MSELWGDGHGRRFGSHGGDSAPARYGHPTGLSTCVISLVNGQSTTLDRHFCMGQSATLGHRSTDSLPLWVATFIRDRLPLQVATFDLIWMVWRCMTSGRFCLLMDSLPLWVIGFVWDRPLPLWFATFIRIQMV